MESNSSKINQTIDVQHDTIVVKTTYDATPMLEDVKYAREVAPDKFGSDYKHVGNVSMELVNVWLKEAGVQWHDSKAVQEVIKKKLISGEFSDLRNWEGTW